MKLYRIPQPWDYHGTGAVFVMADSAEDAVSLVHDAADRESAKKVRFYQEQDRIAREVGAAAGNPILIKAWAAYRAANPDIEYDSTLSRGSFDFDGVEEVESGIGVAEGCDC